MRGPFPSSPDDLQKQSQITHAGTKLAVYFTTRPYEPYTTTLSMLARFESLKKFESLKVLELFCAFL